MTSPLQIRALRAIKARLEGISVDDGFHSNAGDAVMFGPRWPDESDCPCLLVIDGGDFPQPDSGGRSTSSGNHRSMTLAQTIYVDCFAIRYSDPEDAGLAVSELRADVKRAALDYSAQALRDDDGVIGGALAYSGAEPIAAPDGSAVEAFRLTFIHTLQEAYGDPTIAR